MVKTNSIVHVHTSIRGDWFTCKVCGRRHESKDLMAPYQKLYKLCSYCVVWWAKESGRKLEELSNTVKWTEETPCCELKDWQGGFICVLPKGHKGPHIAMDAYGVAVSSWTGDFDR